MIRDELAAAITTAVKTTFKIEISDVEVTDAQSGFGDYSSNIAFGLAKQLGKSPREIATELAGVIDHSSVALAEAAGVGYINFTLTDTAISLAAQGATRLSLQNYKNQTVVTEYSDPNPFKVLHVGHLYTTVIGDAISNLIRLSGGDVHAVNFGGDVGLHVAKTMWAIIGELGGEDPSSLDQISEAGRSEWMARQYVDGTAAYDDDPAAKDSINTLNKRIYQIHTDNDHESPLALIYWTCRQWSYDYFDAFYEQIGSKFERYYPESETAPIGLETVRAEQAKGVYTESNGAVVFEGEKYGLHTRVFITSKGLPSYETKDVGVLMAKWRDYHFDRSIVITGNDITEYMKVVLKSVEQFRPDLTERTTHITHGNVKLAGGVKMSSRKGNFLRAVDVLELAKEAHERVNGRQDDSVVLGAVKYSFLKQGIGADLVFVPDESVSLEGNSGPYLQYAHARACSILAKAAASSGDLKNLTEDERLLAAKLTGYPDVITRAVDELLPHYICTYLYELAQIFNRFYEGNRVIGDPRQAERLRLVELYASVLKHGLNVLGIAAPDSL